MEEGEAQAVKPRTIRRLPMAALALALAEATAGCGPPSRRADESEASPRGLPPAYTRDKILDPKLAGAARAFSDWASAQKAGDAPIFSRVDVLPPTPTLLPYGIGANQKEVRLPAILITGPGWSSLALGDREAIVARAFSDLSNRLAAVKPEPSIRPTVTIQTPEGLELAWVNQIEPGGKYIHGER